MKVMFFLELFCLLLVKIVYGLTGGPYIFINESVGSPVVSTTSGKFVGLTIRETNVWIGIPYANPSVGTLRWQKPQPYVMNNSQSDAIQNATHYSASCPQINTNGGVPEPIDEDCLYLNVWAPLAPPPTSEGYPVMLWIHGGAFIEGSATMAIYDGLSWTNAAVNENNSFIMVSINYRLSVMGFFAQSALLDEKGQTIANQGIADQRIALQWIRDNIAQFGGNRNAITLMGESAGAQSVCLHMVSPLSAGLFHTGILDSGPCDTLLYLRDKSFAYSTANSLASVVGCNTTNSTQQLDCLRTVDSTVLLAAIANVSIPSSLPLAFQNQEKVGGLFPFNIIVDGVEIPVHPLQAFLSGEFNRVPMLTGANHDEFLSRALYEEYYYPPTSAQDYLTRILPIVTYNDSELQQLYDPSQFAGNYTQAFIALLSQSVFLCGARRMADYTSEQPTYLYTYTYTLTSPWLLSPQLTIGPGAYHISELFGLFQTLTASFYGDNMFLPADLPLATSMRRYWTNMITKGQPNDNLSSTWPQYASSADQVLVLDKNITTSTYINVYPNCDLLSAVAVQVLSEYLGFNATCTVGNKCFIINSTTTAHATSPEYQIITLLSLFLLHSIILF